MTENPEVAQRLVAMEGDCGSLGLGLSPSDRHTLVENVSVVFHCAATVRFDETTNHLILVNTRGTREIVRLCKELPKLEVGSAASCMLLYFSPTVFLIIPSRSCTYRQRSAMRRRTVKLRYQRKSLHKTRIGGQRLK